MNIFFTRLDEHSFLNSFQRERVDFLAFDFPLEINDIVIFIVDERIAGAANITSNDLKINFSHIFEPECRESFFRQFHSILTTEWGIHTQVNVENNVPAPKHLNDQLMDKLNEQHSAFAYYLTNLDHLLEETSKHHRLIVKREEQSKVHIKMSNFSILDTPPKEASLHTKAQFYLKELAIITGCEVWTASNDKNRLYKGERIGRDDMDYFPDFLMDEESKKRISLIDTIWFNNDFPVSCFEVETSTSVYSGLLRMADLVSVMPNRDLKIYIVAPNERKEKVLKEMNRPVFQVIGLTHICRFISIESLEALYQKVKGLNGFVHSNVIEAIALNVNELEHLTR